MFTKTRETLPDKPQLQFRILLQRIRHIAVRRRGDGLSPFQFQAAPAPAIPQGLETLVSGNGKKPGAYRGLLTKTWQGLVGGQEYLLGDILAVVCVANHVDAESHDCMLVALHKGFQRFGERPTGQGAVHVVITGLLFVPIHAT